MKRILTILGALSLAACASPHDKPGPLARDVRADAPPDTIGVVLSWSPEQTIVNFRRADQMFAAHTIHHGANVRALPRAAVQIDPMVVQSDGSPAVSIAQLMEADGRRSWVTLRNAVNPFRCASCFAQAQGSHPGYPFDAYVSPMEAPGETSCFARSGA